MLSKQQIFEKVSKHLLKQKCKSMDRDGQCCYRRRERSKTLKCAIGALIPKKEYVCDIEDIGIGAINIYNNDNEKTDKSYALAQVLINSGLDITDDEIMDLLMQLQAIHDTTPTVIWRISLKQIGTKFDLETEFLNGY